MEYKKRKKRRIRTTLLYQNWNIECNSNNNDDDDDDDGKSSNVM